MTFAQATIARRAARPALISNTTAPLTFGGSRSINVAPGQDVLSDPVGFSFQAFEPLAVSIYVAGNVGKPTEHYIARQTSYHGYINAAQRDELAKAVETRHES